MLAHIDGQRKARKCRALCSSGTTLRERFVLPWAGAGLSLHGLNPPSVRRWYGSGTRQAQYSKASALRITRTSAVRRSGARRSRRIEWSSATACMVMSAASRMHTGEMI